MKLITEQIEDVKVITEGTGDSKKLYIEGVFLQSELKNRNGRVYPFSVLEREVNRYNEGNNFIGKAQVLDTPMGRIAKSLLDEGVQLGVSSRGMGSIDKQEGVSYVRDDFMLATAADIVADPSAPDAFVNGIMEGKEWVWDNGILKESKVAKYQRYMSESTRHNLEERTLQVFQNFLAGL